MTKRLPLTVLTTALFTLLLLPAMHAAADEGDATVHQGSWDKETYSTSGQWKIVRNGDNHYVVLDGDFKTRKAPDLKLFLSTKPASELTNKNATANAVRIAKLDSIDGAQRYRLPSSVDLDDYKTLMIHCEKYSKLWSTGSLD